MRTPLRVRRGLGPHWRDLTPQQQAWLWEHLTGGHITLAPPPWQALLQDPRQPTEPLPDDHANRIWHQLHNAWQLDEPATWRPP